MLPNTENAIQRMSKLTSRSNSNSNSKTENIVSIRASELDEDILDSYEGTFTSSEFQNMYATTTTGVGMNDRSQAEYKCIYAIEDELYVNGLPETFDVRKYTGGNECNINICVYRICKGNNAFPYLQYKLMLDQQKNTLKFPTFTHRFDSSDDSSNSNSGMEFMQTKFMKRANDNVMKWSSGISSDNLEFKGIYHYNPLFAGEVIDSIHPSFSADMDGGKPRKNIDDNNISSYRKKFHMEKNINEVLLHGSHFYFYEFCDSIRGACYTYDDVTRKYEKNNSQDGQYIFRYVVFLGKMKTLIFDTGNGTNHLSINNACMTREVNWPIEGYHSICHGKYTLRKGGGKETRDSELKSKYLYSAFSVSDPHRFILLTYHRVDAKSIPPDIETIFEKKSRYAIRIK